MGDDRPTRYEEHGAVYYRASGIGGCEQAMLAAARGMERKPHPDWFQDVLDEGTRMEASIDAAWSERTDVLTINQQNTVQLYVGEIDGKDVYVVGHIDGEAAFTTDSILREYKKIRPSGWERFKRVGVEYNPHYPWQVAAYMIGGKFQTCEFVGGLYDPDKDEITDVYGHVIHQPPVNLKAIRTKIVRVERLVNQGYAPGDEGVTCNQEFPCPYWYLHEGADAPSTPATETQVDMAAVGEWLIATEQLAKMRGEMRVWDEQKRRAQAVIIDEMRKAGIGDSGQILCEGLVIDLKTVVKKEHTVREVTYPQLTIKPTDGQSSTEKE